ncbi:uncharacterized protein SPPG_06436 [Spizellomyces punctatus DAOM BR117]|uniref:Hypervirulence associated protein TUDOR domain-containing protein n=1 Tax=Spizellomyces punctatus (strain DAOM BR117) TaxID=645134 RepID=A0A0L0HA07_SPIPD|nr:uncharacterized protein SPPG_06436 [Spizellomyces punctatus DAOM BR117]KNC98017.1 hypothetical protein SPPG_06436 [Spizellomyces punctatus DAOM BR117]|eukprot:XP_016606057.1 hypothetical protein SPPG_06436 [Spizellomyces punctatus DAOM BR117]
MVDGPTNPPHYALCQTGANVFVWQPTRTPQPIAKVVKGTPVVGNWVDYPTPEGPSRGEILHVGTIDYIRADRIVTDDSPVYVVEDENTLEHRVLSKRSFTKLSPAAPWITREGGGTV